MKTGIYRDLSNQAYHADPAISSTKLKKLLNGTPAHFKYALENPEVIESEALLRGSLLHSMLLEPNKWISDYIIESQPLPDKTKLEKNGGSKGEWDLMKKQAQNEQLPLVKYEIYRDCIGMRNSVYEHPYWKNIGEHAAKEISLFAEIEGVSVKARYDCLLANSHIIDLKSSRNTLTNASIQKTITGLGYHLSAAMYIEVGKALGFDVDGFTWAFVESTAPFSCRFVKASPSMLAVGKDEFYKCLAKIKACTKDNSWPAYSLEIDEIELPNWYANKEFLFESELANV